MELEMNEEICLSNSIIQSLCLVKIYLIQSVFFVFFLNWHKRRSSFNFRGARHFARKYVHEKLTKCPNFT